MSSVAVNTMLTIASVSIWLREQISFSKVCVRATTCSRVSASTVTAPRTAYKRSMRKSVYGP